MRDARWIEQGFEKLGEALRRIPPPLMLGFTVIYIAMALAFMLLRPDSTPPSASERFAPSLEVLGLADVGRRGRTDAWLIGLPDGSRCFVHERGGVDCDWLPARSAQAEAPTPEEIALLLQLLQPPIDRGLVSPEMLLVPCGPER